MKFSEMLNELRRSSGRSHAALFQFATEVASDHIEMSDYQAASPLEPMSKYFCRRSLRS